ncbi:MAG: hypothetical protein AAGI66_05880 [Cyanobacteria bacterium P01_H01_bin.74]
MATVYLGDLTQNPLLCFCEMVCQPLEPHILAIPYGNLAYPYSLQSQPSVVQSRADTSPLTSQAMPQKNVQQFPTLSQSSTVPESDKYLLDKRLSSNSFKNSHNIIAPQNNSLPFNPFQVGSIQYSGNPQITDHFLNPRYSLSARQAVQYFTSGLAIFTLAKHALQNKIVKAAAHVSKQFDSKSVAQKDIKDYELSIYQNYNEPLSSIYRFVQFDPSQGKALALYASISVLGYFAGSLVQGAQESWVRQQESKIRASLIDSLSETFRSSIREKQKFDATLKQNTKQSILILLQAARIPLPFSLSNDKPTLEPPRINQHFFYEPTHRTLPFGQSEETTVPPPINASDSNSLNGLNQPASHKTLWPVRLQKIVSFLLGGFTGFVLHHFFQLLLAGQHIPSQERDKAKVMEGLMLKDKESWSMIGVKNPRNFAIMAGFFAMSAAAAVGKTFLDGLRAIEVTRLNAKTELDYQKHNWLSQDPMFHAIAEEEAVKSQLIKLKEDLSQLRSNPVLLDQRITAILQNIGRNSAPPYYLMTPAVGLTDARS